MSFARYLRELDSDDRNAGLSEDDAHHLFGAMLDGGVPEMELGALLTALRGKLLDLNELFGFFRALGERTARLALPASALRPVVLPAYGATREYPNLLPLVALLLQRFGVPVLVHGTLESGGGTGSAHVLRELGVLPSAGIAPAQEALAADGFAFLPVAALNPALAALIALRARLGFNTVAHTVARLITPFAGEGFRVVGSRSAAERATLREFLLSSGARALLLDLTEGEPFANPDRRPQLEYIAEGDAQLLFDTELGAVRAGAQVPTDAAGTAGWIRQALAGDVSIPLPVVNQVACCLFGAGYTENMNQAKAIVAVETRTHASV
jgi:anthranilate phosphoribosyltransferase